MGLRPIKLKQPKCEICGKFVKQSLLLCKACYNKEVRGQDHEIYRVGPKKDIIISKDDMNMILHWNVDEGDPECLK